MTLTYTKPTPGIEEQQKIPWEQHVSAMMMVREEDDRAQEFMGRLAILARNQYGKEAIPKLATECFIKKKALYEYIKVCETFKKSFRDEYKRMSFSHFRICAHQTGSEGWLMKAHDFNWTVENLVMEIAKSKPKKDKPDELCPKCGYNLNG